MAWWLARAGADAGTLTIGAGDSIARTTLRAAVDAGAAHFPVAGCGPSTVPKTSESLGLNRPAAQTTSLIRGTGRSPIESRCSDAKTGQTDCFGPAAPASAHLSTFASPFSPSIDLIE